MEPISTGQEILLMTGTTFSARQYNGQDGKESAKNQSLQEHLLEACWNGMLPEILPEICKEQQGTRLFIWKITEAQAFIAVEAGAHPAENDKHFSIDPYMFLQEQVLC